MSEPVTMFRVEIRADFIQIRPVFDESGEEPDYNKIASETAINSCITVRDATLCAGSGTPLYDGMREAVEAAVAGLMDAAKFG